MDKFVPIRICSFGVSKILYQKGLGFVLIILFGHVFKNGKIREFNLNQLNS